MLVEQMTSHLFTIPHDRIVLVGGETRQFGENVELAVDFRCRHRSQPFKAQLQCAPLPLGDQIISAAGKKRVPNHRICMLFEQPALDCCPIGAFDRISGRTLADEHAVLAHAARTVCNRSALTSTAAIPLYHRPRATSTTAAYRTPAASVR